MSSLPTGMVTFLFTDIERSVSHWERDPEAMRSKLSVHDRLVRESVASRGGAVFKSLGDGMCAAFESVPPAVNAAVSIQRRLRENAVLADLRVRMAIHAGEVEERDGDYLGPPVNRVARLLTATHGGQTIVSGAARDACGGQVGAGVELIDLGEHRLRDLARPSRVYQVVHPDLPSEFPPLASLDRVLHNLPIRLTRFVGRERELAELDEAIEESRLVSLTGVGGSGKTRLALQAAADRVEEHPGGVWFVDLAPLEDPRNVWRAVASAVGVREDEPGPLPDQVIERLSGEPTLVLLDNCEHVIEEAAAVADRLLRSGSAIRVVATSREPLGVPGEVVWPVVPLSHPTGGESTVEEVADHDAVELFLDRARLAAPRFEMTDETAPAVAEVCRRLDGIPLAVELAAARARTLPVAEIARRLDDRLSLLIGGGRTALPRHRTLRAAIDWSHELLDLEERAVFRRLAVFVGGWTLDAAERVVPDPVPDPAGEEDEEPDGRAAPRIDREAVLDLLSRLVDKSLVHLEEVDGEPRYGFVETIREYARERLVDAGAARDALRRRHLDWCVELAVDLYGRPDQVQRDPEDRQQTTTRVVDREIDNLRAALRRCVESGEGIDSMVRILHGTDDYWTANGMATEGAEWVRRALEIGPESDLRRFQGLTTMTYMLGAIGEFDEGTEYGDRALALARGLESDEHLLEALAVASRVRFIGGRIDEAVSLAEEGLALARGSGANWRAGILFLMLLGEWYRAEGRFDEARAMYEDGIRKAEEFGFRGWLRMGLFNLGQALLELGEVERALGSYRRSYALGSSSRLALNRYLPVLGTAQALAARAEHERATRLFAAVERGLEERGMPFDVYEPVGRPLRDRAVAACRDAIG
ncbi:MAG: tetratricopeptide repeat protein, partial [Gemmatimonadota bacterium]|nr:tetratricopeptide repeat protein [Gemmatimonadota bacterium]